MSDPRLHQPRTVIRPSSRLLWKRYGRGIIVLAIAGTSAALRIATAPDETNRVENVSIVLLVGVLIIGFAVSTAMRVRNQRIEYSPGEFVVQNRFGARSTTPRDRIEHAVVLWTPVPSYRERASLVLIDGEGNRLAHIDSELWPIGRLATLAGALVEQPESDLAPLDLADARRRFARAIPWRIAHPYLSTTVFVAVGLAAFGAWLLVTLLISGRL